MRKEAEHEGKQMPRGRTSPDGAYSGIRNVKTVMPQNGQHSQNCSSDQREQHDLHGRNDKQEGTSKTPKLNPDSNGHSHAPTKAPYSQVVARSTRTTTSASAQVALRIGTSQMSGPPGLTQTTPRQYNSGVDSPTERQTKRNEPVANPTHRHETSPEYPSNRNGSAVNPIRRQPDATHLPTGNALVKSGAAPRQWTNDADNAIENVLSQLDETGQQDIQIYQERIRERMGLQRLLRECFEFQQKEYGDAFKDLNIKMQNITHERDDLQKRTKILQDEVKKLQQQLHARSIEQPNPVVVATSPFTPHTADGVSGRDLIEDMERLNDEIYQFAAHLAEQFQKTPEGRKTDALRIHPSDIRVLQKLFGQNIVNFVVQARARQEHSWLIHAVQACIIESCRSVLISMLPFKKVSSSFEDVHRHIRSREGQGMSGQWRSLVCRHGLDVEETEHQICEFITDDVWQLCRILGWSAQDSTHRDSLKSIASRTFHLHRTIYVEILSGDITIISPELGTPFNPMTMEVSDVRSADAKLPPVLCTTDMGLMKSAVEKVFSDEGYKIREPNTVILKAKVFLDGDDDSSWYGISRNNSRSS